MIEKFLDKFQQMPPTLKVFTILVIAFGLLIPAIRIARMAKLRGKNPFLWFFIGLPTAIPATILFWLDDQRNIKADEVLGSRLRKRPYAQPPKTKADAEPQIAAKPKICPHCGQAIPADSTGPCPNCGMTRPKEHLA